MQQRDPRAWHGAIAAACLTLAACAAAPPAADPLSAARIAEIIASPERSEADRTNDLRRKPQQMLAFIGIRPGIVVLDLSAGGGYTTELVARAIGPGGKVYGQSPPRVPRPAPAQPEGAGAPPAATAPATPPHPPPGLAARAKALTAG